MDSKGKRRTATRLTAASIVAIVFLLSFLFVHQKTTSARFAALRMGMTPEEVLDTLSPIHSTESGPLDLGPGFLVWRVHYSEDLLFPDFTAVITMKDLRVVGLELRKPTGREILQRWWEKVREF